VSGRRLARLGRIVGLCTTAFGVVSACEDDPAAPPGAAPADASAGAAEASPGTSTPDASPAPDVVDGAARVDTGPPRAQVVPCSAIHTAFGTPVALTAATATFSQSSDFRIGKVIDGVLTDQRGWAIAPRQTTPQTAVFETASDTGAFPSGTRFVFVLKHGYDFDHVIGRFRLAITTAPRTSFADGNEGTGDAGDVGRAELWTTIAPRLVCASNDAALSVLADGSILADDTDASQVDYVVEAETSLTAITGVRLDVIPDPSLPEGGAGTQDANGNFVLAELVVHAGPR
jgi:hypothetical protein